MQLTGQNLHNDITQSHTQLRNATCVGTQTSKVLTRVTLLFIPYTVVLYMYYIDTDVYARIYSFHDRCPVLVFVLNERQPTRIAKRFFHGCYSTSSEAPAQLDEGFPKNDA